MTTKDNERTGRFVTLAVSRTIEDAQIMRSRLESEGIAVLIPREGMARPLVSDVSILVDASELKHAKEILESVRPGEYALGDDFKIQHSARSGPVPQAKNDAATINPDEAEEKRPGVLIVLGAHLVASTVSAFVLLSEMRWDALDMSRRINQWSVAIIALAAIWPYIASWLFCRKSMPNRVRSWTFVVVLAVVSAAGDIGYLRGFSLFGWVVVAGITVGQAAICIIVASLILDSTSKIGGF
jgi:hypothetical protein